MKYKVSEKILSNKWIMSFIIFIISIKFLIPLINGYMRILENRFNVNYNLVDIHNLLDCFKAIINNKIIGLIYVIIVIILIFAICNINYTRKQMKIENEGIKIKEKDGTHGTANFTTAEKINVLHIGNEDLSNGIVLGKTLDTDEIITLPDSYTSINRNIMIWGASGSGKSTSFIIPNMLKIVDQESRCEQLENCALKGKNVVCTDPKGELYEVTKRTFENQGYDVKVFNLVNPEHSDGIDLIKFIDNEIDAQTFAQVVINTTKNQGNKGEEFWANNEENLLKALLLHIRFEVEDESKQNMRYLNSLLASGNIKSIDEVFKGSKGITKIAYNIYSQATDTIKQSTITGLATKLQIFQLEKIAAITERNDIDFVNLNEKKMAIFLIVSDMDTTMNFLNSLFFSFLFIKTIRIADSNPEKCLKRQNMFFLDEFQNIRTNS